MVLIPPKVGSNQPLVSKHPPKMIFFGSKAVVEITGRTITTLGHWSSIFVICVTIKLFFEGG